MTTINRHLALTAKAVLQWTGPDNARANNILYFLALGTTWTATGNLNALANGIETAMTTGTNSIIQFASNQWHCDTIAAIDNDGVTEMQVVQNGPGAGLSVGPCLPPSTAWCSSWQISAYYRGGKPRTYWPGVPASTQAVSGGRLIATAVLGGLIIATNTFLSQLSALPLATGSCAMGTVSGSRHHAQLVPPVFYPYMSGVVHHRLDTQRRRMGKEVL